MIHQKMRLRRIDNGALTLASAEVKFQIDTETHDPLDIGIIFLTLNVIWYFFLRSWKMGIFLLFIISLLKCMSFFLSILSNSQLSQKLKLLGTGQMNGFIS